jgi:hypothetical protein
MSDLVKALQRLEIAGRRGRGMGKKTWRKYVEEDMRVLELEEYDVHNRLKWRRDIGKTI